MELLYYICVLSSINGLNGKEQKAITKVPRKVLVIETDVEDQRSFLERNKGSDFIIYSICSIDVIWHIVCRP